MYIITAAAPSKIFSFLGQPSRAITATPSATRMKAPCVWVKGYYRMAGADVAGAESAALTAVPHSGHLSCDARRSYPQPRQWPDFSRFCDRRMVTTDQTATIASGK